MTEKKDLEKLLKEEAKRMVNIVEYTFHGIVDEDDEEPADMEGEPELDGGEDLGGEEGTGDEELDGEIGDLEDELGLGDEPAPEDDFGGEEPAMDEPDISMDEPVEDEVELDVTELVTSTEEAKESSDAANAKLEDLINGFAQLQGQLGAMQQTSAKIDELGNKVTELEHDIERRNPTPEEQIEMRSLDSYPYNLKLTDYWSDKEDKLDIPSSEQDGGTKEYTLTKQDVDDYSPSDIKKSFNQFDEDEVDY